MDDTTVMEIKSPGMDLYWKLIKKKQKQDDVRIVNKQKKLVLISLILKISDTLPSNLITFSPGFYVVSTFEAFGSRADARYLMPSNSNRKFSISSLLI